jgi:hypothetical protein
MSRAPRMQSAVTFVRVFGLSLVLTKIDKKPLKNQIHVGMSHLIPIKSRSKSDETPNP